MSPYPDGTASSNNQQEAQQQQSDDIVVVDGGGGNSVGVVRRRQIHGLRSIDNKNITKENSNVVNKQQSMEDNMSSTPKFARIIETSLTDTDIAAVYSSSYGVEDLFFHLQKSWENFNGSSFIINTTSKSTSATPRDKRPVYQLNQQGAKAKYPVIMMPGFVTSGLEVWGGEECARKHFRQRLWGALDTVTTFFTDQECFLQHLALDPHAGGDPNNGRIRLRPAQGFEAADYFMATYWVWDKLILNLADVGYDGTSMLMMSYDWRLSFPLLEERDGYFTKLRYNIEAYHKTSGQKVVLASHSMGGEVVLYFFAWVTTKEKDGGGGGGPKWVDEHIHAFINIAGTLLGVPKASTALMSGEFRESSVLLGTVGSMLETFFGRRRRKDLFSTWGSVWSMLPKGGDKVWGVGADICNNTSIQDGLYCKTTEIEKDAVSPGSTTIKTNNIVPLLQMTDKPANTDLNSNVGDDETCISSSNSNNEKQGNLIVNRDKELSMKVSEYLVDDNAFTAAETVDFLMNWGGGFGPTLSAVDKWLRPNHSSINNNSNSNKDLSRQLLPSPQTWHDPTVTPLPHAPSLKIYCMYGVGSKSERAYFYKRSDANKANNNDSADNQCANGSDSNSNLGGDFDYDLPFVMDTTMNDDKNDIKKGVKFVDGDGSVPLISLGYMCADQWRKTDGKLNPSNVDVITREYAHRQSFHVDDPMRGGPQAADHVDILGNVDMTEDFLRIVTDFDVTAKVQTKIVSDIIGISQRINERR